MKKKPDPPKAFPLWQSTFSDLMNLLLCFFVLLFSMSSINEEKYLQIVNSLQSAFTTVISTGGSTVVPAKLVSSGITQLPDYSNYFGDTMSKGNEGGQIDPGGSDSSGQQQGTVDTDEKTEEEKEAEAKAELEKKALEESERMAEHIEALATEMGIQDMIEVDFNGNYVRITMSGALLFDSGSATLRDQAVPIVQKLGTILNNYPNNLIEVEGHTDNVPIHSQRFEDNDVLSMYRALYVSNVLRDSSTINPGHVKSSGCGEYDPIADNSTPEGRARNRRVDVKVYNSYNSGDIVSEGI